MANFQVKKAWTETLESLESKRDHAQSELRSLTGRLVNSDNEPTEAENKAVEELRSSIGAFETRIDTVRGELKSFDNVKITGDETRSLSLEEVADDKNQPDELRYFAEALLGNDQARSSLATSDQNSGIVGPREVQTRYERKFLDTVGPAAAGAFVMNSPTANPYEIPVAYSGVTVGIVGKGY